MQQNHKCGQCEDVFESEQAYLEHTCEVTGFTPQDQEHQGPEFVNISNAALERGEARKGEKTHPASGGDAKKAKKKN